MRRIVLTVLAIAVLAVALFFLLVSPPAQLSFLDGVMGGGSGVERPGSAVAFGTQGQTLDVWRPAGADKTPKPVVIFWYGGGWATGDRRAYAFAARAYAKAGFVVVVPDYRKVPQVHFPAFLQDGAEAVKWTRDHIAEFGGDPNRIAFAGHSAGAYIAVMLALDTRWLKADGVDPRIVKAVVGLSGPYDFYPFASRRAKEAMSNAEDPASTQPITFARADAPPMLLVTSTKDTEVRPQNAVSLGLRLHAMGAHVRLSSYPGLTHEEVVMALSVPFRSKAPVLEDSVVFLRTTL